MTYQDPAFMVAHPSAQQAIADIVANAKATTFSDDSKRALIDSRQGELASFTATGTFAGFSIDMGTTSFADPVNRVVIPAGHTFNGFQISVVSGVTLGGLSSRANPSITDSDVIDLTFADRTGDQFWGLQVVDSTAEVFSFAEYWAGEYKSLTLGEAKVDPGFVREYTHDVESDTFGGRTSSLELSPPRRKFSLHMRSVDPADADFATIEEVMLNGPNKPFWYWTPDDSDPGPYLVKLIRSASRKQGSQVPTNSIKYEVRFEMLEQIT